MTKKYGKIISLILCCSLIFSFTSDAASNQAASGTACIKDGKNLYYKKGNEASASITISKAGAKDKKLAKVGTDKFFIQGKFVYFALKDGIYKMKKNGKNKKRIYKGSVKVIDISGKYIYFTNYKNLNQKDIVRISLEGKGKKMLKKASIQSNPVMVNNRIYFVDRKDKVYRLSYVSLSSKKSKVILNDELYAYGALFADRTNIYVQANIFKSMHADGGRLGPAVRQICRIDKNNKVEALVISKDQDEVQDLKILAVDGGMVYYTTLSNGGFYDLYKIPAAGGDSKLVITANAQSLPNAKGVEQFSSIIVSGKWIAALFDCDTQSPVVYTFTIDGKKAAKVNAKKIYDIVDGKLYYGSSAKSAVYKSLKLK